MPSGCRQKQRPAVVQALKAQPQQGLSLLTPQAPQLQLRAPQQQLHSTAPVQAV